MMEGIKESLTDYITEYDSVCPLIVFVTFDLNCKNNF